MALRSILFVAAALAVPALSAANLVTNGGFETVDFTGVANGGDYFVFTPTTALPAEINAWTVGGTSVDIVQGPSYPPATGKYALDLVGTPGPGSVSQSLSVGSAGDYFVRFNGRATQGLPNATITVSLGSMSQSVDIVGGWTSYTVVFSGVTAGSQLLTIASNPNNNTNGNVFVDDIEADVVPEPATLAALGIGALAMLRRKRR